MMKLLARLFGDKIRLVKMGEKEEKAVLAEMRKIQGIYDYWELQRQTGYNLYGRTNDRRYLGWVSQAEHILIQLDDSKVESSEEQRLIDNGYHSTV